jgi:general stress protein 26
MHTLQIADLWHTFDTVYFPSGKDDPDIRLIRVEAESVEYWDSPSSSLVHAYRMVKTALTGDWDVMGEHERRALAA